MITRNTIQKQIILDTVQAMHNHPTAEFIYEVIACEHPSISKATVYRNLSQLASQGTILRIPVPNSADRFDFNTAMHYHVRCHECGEVFDVDVPSIHGLVEEVKKSSGVQIDRYDILFEGTCEKCLNK